MVSVLGVLGKDRLKSLAHFLSLPFGGFHQAAQHAVVFQSFIGAGAVNDVAHDDHGAQAALGVVVCGRNMRMLEASEEEILLLA